MKRLLAGVFIALLSTSVLAQSRTILVDPNSIPLGTTGNPLVTSGGGGGGGGGTSSNFGAAFPAAGTALGVTNGTNMVSVTGDGTGMDVIGEGTAGSPAGGVLSIQGVSGGTAQSVSVSDGASVTLGTKADAAWSSGSGSEISILKKMDADIQGGAGTIGSAVPTTGIYMGGISAGNLTGIIQGDTSASISVASTTSQIIALASGKKTYITHIEFTTSAAQVVTVEYGTGTNCGTVVGTLTAHQLAANGGISAGAGLGPVLIVPASDEVCIISTSGTTSGAVTYTQF